MSNPLSMIGAVGTGIAVKTPLPAEASNPTHDFKAMLQAIAAQTVTDVKTAEATAIAGIEGRMDTRKVVDAVMAAEHSLQTAIAVRDKIVSAYLDLSRMQI